MLVNVLIYKVYLYDDSITIIFNTQNKPYKEKMPLIEELEEKLGACSYKVRSAQPNQKIMTFKKLKVLIFAYKGGFKFIYENNFTFYKTI